MFGVLRITFTLRVRASTTSQETVFARKIVVGIGRRIIFSATSTTMGLCASSKPAVPSGMKLHILPPSANSHGCIAVVKDLGMDIEVSDTAGISYGPYLFSREL